MPVEIDGLSDELKGHEVLQGYDDVNGLVGDLVKLKTEGPTINIPDDQKENPLLKDIKGPDDLITKVVELGGKVMNRPESPDEYTFDFPEGKGPQDEAAKADFDAFKKFVHEELGADPERFQKLVDYELKRQDTMLNHFEEQRTEGWKELQEKYHVDEKTGSEKALAVANKIGEEALEINRMLSQFFGFGEKMHPAFAEIMLKLEKSLSEGAFAGGDTNPDDLVKTDEFGRPVFDYSKMASA